MQRDSKIAIVEYLRGFAALAVAWFHCTNQYAPGPVQISGSWGWLGIGVFFVISGFVLPYSIWQREGEHYGPAQASRFAWRRIVRIEPPYLISAAMTVGLWYLSAMAPGFRGAAPDASWEQLAAHVAYLPRVLGYEWIQPVYWTLAYEFMFYAALGLSYGLFIRRPVATALVLLLAAEGLSLALRGRFDAWVPLFGVGAAVFLGRAGKLGAGRAAAAVIALSSVSAWLDPRVGATGFVSALLLHAFAHGRLPQPVHRVAMFVGMISYSLYITHVPVAGRVINLGTRFVHTEGARMALSLAAVATAVLFAWLFWRFVERYFVALAHRGKQEPAQAITA